MLAKLAPHQQTLLRAAEIIRERGLYKGDYGTPGEPRCVLGALREAAGDETGFATEEAASCLMSHLGREALCPSLWNDAPERTADDVVAALQAAALTS